MKLLVIYGGSGLSREAEISKLSGLAVADAARLAGFTVTKFELTAENLNQLPGLSTEHDLAIPVLHGEWGEDGQIQSVLERAKIPYIGANVTASELCWDKHTYKQKLVATGITTPGWQIITQASELDTITAPIVIKPVKGGSSFDMIVAKTDADIDTQQLASWLNRYGQLMAEEYIDGQEISVGILNDTALPVAEIIPPYGRWFDSEVKYNGTSIENVPPKHISREIQTQAQALALQIHQLTGCRHLSRTDMMIKDGQIYVLETNTMPGLTAESIYPKEAQASGLNLSQLINRLVRMTAGETVRI